LPYQVLGPHFIPGSKPKDQPVPKKGINEIPFEI